MTRFHVQVRQMKAGGLINKERKRCTQEREKAEDRKRDR
jgi:hypothetical protein